MKKTVFALAILTLGLGAQAHWVEKTFKPKKVSNIRTYTSVQLNGHNAKCFYTTYRGIGLKPWYLLCSPGNGTMVDQCWDKAIAKEARRQKFTFKGDAINNSFTNNLKSSGVYTYTLNYCK